MRMEVLIGVDPHKATHSVDAVDKGGLPEHARESLIRA
jgi:hypothetical protein